MSSNVWKVIYQTIVRMNRTLSNGRRKCQYADTLIVAMYIWSVMHDRPRCWAAERSSYYGPFRPRRLPSRSQFERRLAAPRGQALWEATWKELARSEESSPVSCMDGRALTVGPYSQDRDAGKGFVSNHFAKGYKLHAITKQCGKTTAWRVKPLNVCEKNVAEDLIPEAKPQGLLLADGYYDSGPLYELALCGGALLLTPFNKNAGRGHRPQFEARVLAIRAWKHGGKNLYRLRTDIERRFSQHSSFGGGLAPLPPWVRGLHRVTQWVGTKLMIYHVRLTLHEAAA